VRSGRSLERNFVTKLLKVSGLPPGGSHKSVRYASERRAEGLALSRSVNLESRQKSRYIYTLFWRCRWTLRKDNALRGGGRRGKADVKKDWIWII
jgi:hypothetical protein